VTYLNGQIQSITFDGKEIECDKNVTMHIGIDKGSNEWTSIVLPKDGMFEVTGTMEFEPCSTKRFFKAMKAHDIKMIYRCLLGSCIKNNGRRIKLRILKKRIKKYLKRNNVVLNLA